MAFGLHNNLFNHIDANHDGMIDLNEMRNFAIFQQADRNHDGRITLQEFAQTAGKF
jgi:Ca2+-binding EF-hand superfamily protein